jgi:molecular chaperone HscB
MTATLNEAVHTLRDPVARARYLLGLKGIDTGEETDTSMSPAFLMTQMELREQFAEVRDASGPPDRFDAVRAHAESACRERISTLQRSFATGDAASLQAARNAVRELQFLRKVLADIDALAEDR